MGPSLLGALAPLLKVLAKLDVPYQVGGSVACSVHGVPRSSLDVDVLVSIEPNKVDALVHSIDEEYYVSRSHAHEAVERGTAFNIIHLDTMMKVDIFIAKADRFRRQSLARRILETFEEETQTASIYITGAEDIVLHKLVWFRKGDETSEHQWQDVLGVLRVQGNSLDVSYMKTWASELGVADLLERASLEAGLATE